MLRAGATRVPCRLERRTRGGRSPHGPTKTENSTRDSRSALRIVSSRATLSFAPNLALSRVSERSPAATGTSASASSDSGPFSSAVPVRGPPSHWFLHRRLSRRDPLAPDQRRHVDRDRDTGHQKQRHAGPQEQGVGPCSRRRARSTRRARSRGRDSGQGARLRWSRPPRYPETGHVRYWGPCFSERGTRVKTTSRSATGWTNGPALGAFWPTSPTGSSVLPWRLPG